MMITNEYNEVYHLCCMFTCISQHFSPDQVLLTVSEHTFSHVFQRYFTNNSYSWLHGEVMLIYQKLNRCLVTCCMLIIVYYCVLNTQVNTNINKNIGVKVYVDKTNNKLTMMDIRWLFRRQKLLSKVYC